MADEDRALFEAAIAPEPTPAPAETPPAPVPAEPPAPPTPEPAEAGIPSWRLREEAERARVAEDRARQLQERLTSIETHLRQQAPPPDFFANPDQAMQAALNQSLRPLVEEFQRGREQDRRERMYLGKMVAESAHGADKVSAAEQAFLDARERETLAPEDYEAVVQAPNRYDAVVRWHKRQTVAAAVGDDPEAWYQKRLEADMAKPEFQAQMLERVRGAAAGRPSTNRLPPSLSRATAAAGNGPDTVGDLSDSSLWAKTMGPAPKR